MRIIGLRVIERVPSNQVVGSSNLSGRAFRDWVLAAAEHLALSNIRASVRGAPHATGVP
jgi:hypothetical protein